MDPKYVEILSGTILFNDIDIGDIPHILSCLNAEIVMYRKNDYVVKVNDPYNGMFVVMEGEAAIVREYVSGNRVTVNINRVGDFFGEPVAFSGLTKWPATIQALTDCVLLVFNPERILDMCRRPCSFHKVILSNLIRVLSKKCCLMNRKIEFLTLKTIHGKLSKYLLEQSEESGAMTFKLPLNREDLADYLNISRPSMSRELGNMRDAGIIEFYRESFRILDRARLEALMEE